MQVKFYLYFYWTIFFFYINYNICLSFPPDFSGTTVEVDGMEVPEELAPYLRELESEDEEAVEV